MRGKTVVVILTIICLLLAAGALYLNMVEDDTAPEITIDDSDMTYYEGQSSEYLLQGVSALDDVDGDLTDRIYISDIIEMDNGSAKVIYAVSDSSKNTTTAYRIVNYVPDESKEQETQEEEEDTQEEEEETRVLKSDNQTGNTGNNSREEKDDDKKKPEEPDTVKPVIELNYNTVTVAKGSDWSFWQAIRDFSDDVTDRDTLAGQIRTEGDYYLETAGTYTIVFTVSDEAGNVSDPKTLTLVVQ